MSSAILRALQEIAGGAWTESGDLLGATYAELRAVVIAKTALAEVKEHRIVFVYCERCGETLSAKWTYCYMCGLSCPAVSESSIGRCNDV